MITPSRNDHADKLILYFHPVGEDIGLTSNFLRPLCDSWNVITCLLGSRGFCRVPHVRTVWDWACRDWGRAVQRRCHRGLWLPDHSVEHLSNKANHRARKISGQRPCHLTGQQSYVRSSGVVHSVQKSTGRSIGKHYSGHGVDCSQHVQQRAEHQRSYLLYFLSAWNQGSSSSSRA